MTHSFNNVCSILHGLHLNLLVHRRVAHQVSDSNSPKEESDKNQKEASQKSEAKEKVLERYKDRIENLTIVSTLIITASVAACLAVPGEAEGKAHSLCHAMFHAFIIFITISLFSSISATIILFWATLGLTELVTFTLKMVMPLLGIALISLSLAFMASLYTVISELTWLSNVSLVMALIFIAVVIALYMLSFLPSSSTSKPLRYISHYLYLFLASRTESKHDHGCFDQYVCSFRVSVTNKMPTNINL
ncbi:putative PGG domain, protein accelerated cell death 6 [Medicago truncatula]|uniref:Putative PGG domain, protein accelerated cell death 6 n=1 Tax=Medicago truncatula TaxID=3880 RepID=A0A396J9A2_MEDTR|nr:putative PGG domain, protein accelerated cell death 6 [Medicago truncatula]